MMLDSPFDLAVAREVADRLALPVEKFAPPRWRLDVRIRGHWTACGLHGSSAAAFAEGLRQLTLAGELNLAVRPCRPGFVYRTWHARHLPGTASLRVEEDPPARPFLLPAKKGAPA